jgi:outer membrane murein-binding lipoprotein Lpp
MTDLQEEKKLVGAMVRHAEALQGQAEQMLGKVDARMLTLQKTVAQLLIGIDERSKALSTQEQRLSAQIDAFAQQVAQLGPQAFAGGKAAVAPEVRAALQGAASVIGAAAQAVTDPAQKTMTASLDALDRAQLVLTQAQARFSSRVLAIIGATALGALVLAGLGGFALIGWQRLEISNAKQELSELQARAQTVGATVAEMEKKGRELDAKGVRFQTSTCQDNDGRKRLCVEIEPGAPLFSQDGDKKQFRVPKGF